MNKALLAVKDLQVTVDGKVVLSQLQFELGSGEVAFLMGANGSGKSSLVNVLLGNPNYVVETGSVWFDQHDLLTMSSHERARAGIFVGWQNPVTVPGVTVFNLCKASFEAQGGEIDKLTDFKAKLEQLAIRVGLSVEHIGRGVNEGFSGGEKKRLELLQLLLLKPKLAVLDEVDSGIDVEGIKMSVKILSEVRGLGTSVILITHNKRLFDQVVADHKWEMSNGRLSTRI